LQFIGTTALPNHCFFLYRCSNSERCSGARETFGAS